MVIMRSRDPLEIYQEGLKPSLELFIYIYIYTDVVFLKNCIVFVFFVRQKKWRQIEIEIFGEPTFLFSFCI